VIRDRRPYYVKRFVYRFQDWYVEHFIRPQLTSLGQGYHFIRPWNVKLFGRPIEVGQYTHFACAPTSNISLVIWGDGENSGRIKIGDYCLITPGVRISSAVGVEIGNNCMLASGVYITDADWHGIYNRLDTIGQAAPVVLKENVWIGDSAILCKGVTIGENSIVGAGAIVTGDVPDNCVAAGNPARVVKLLDPEQGFTKREQLFADPPALARYMNNFDREYLKNNTLLGWLRTLVFPRIGD